MKQRKAKYIALAALVRAPDDLFRNEKLPWVRRGRQDNHTPCIRQKETTLCAAQFANILRAEEFLLRVTAQP